MLLRLLITFFFFLSISSAKVVLINQNDSKVSILEHSYMYIDKSSKLKFEEVKEKNFEPSNTDYIRFDLATVYRT